jgi:hypothetical protein
MKKTRAPVIRLRVIYLICMLAATVASCAPPGGPSAAGPIAVTVSGTLFRPAFEFGRAAALTIDYGDGGAPAALGVPAGVFPCAPHTYVDGVASHTVTITVSPWSALTVVNVGFRGGDGGNGDWERSMSRLPYVAFHPTFDAVPASADEAAAVYDYVGTVTGISGLAAAPNLIAVCCEYQPLESLDLSGCRRLLTLEGFLSEIKAASFQDCVSLRRCCLESTGAHLNWRVENGVRVEDEVLDLSDCPDLYDIRGTGDDHTMLRLNPEALGRLWHLCKMGNGRLQSVRIGGEAPQKLDVTRFTNLVQCWIAGSPVIGALVITNGRTDSVWANDCGITAVAVRDQTQLHEIIMSRNPLTGIDVTGATGLERIELEDCRLTAGQIHSLLHALVAADRPVSPGNFWVNVGGDLNAVPDANGLADAGTLSGRGWTVTVRH